MMPKSDIIAAILNLNPTADPVFLAEFSNAQLDEYLRRLRPLPKRLLTTTAVPVQRVRLVAAVAPQGAV